MFGCVSVGRFLNPRLASLSQTCSATYQGVILMILMGVGEGSSKKGAQVGADLETYTGLGVDMPTHYTKISQEVVTVLNQAIFV